LGFLGDFFDFVLREYILNVHVLKNWEFFIEIYFFCVSKYQLIFLTFGEQIFGYQFRKEEKSDSLPLKGLRPL
jgi:hypothetical protein